jgi:hypothetical protein
MCNAFTGPGNCGGCVTDGRTSNGATAGAIAVVRCSLIAARTSRQQHPSARNHDIEYSERRSFIRTGGACSAGRTSSTGGPRRSRSDAEPS